MSEELDLDEIEKRAGAATEGPWFNPAVSACPACKRASARKCEHGDQIGRSIESLLCYFPDEDAARFWHHDTDGEFAAHARSDVPNLCAEVRRLRAERDVILAALDESVGEVPRALVAGGLRAMLVEKG